ncbi:class I SAM-dependent methyltransferase [Caldicellulosiruptoraceae bacterium PP1]
MEIQEILKMNKLYNTHWWFKGKYKIVHKLIEKNLKIKYTPRVLDIGCGPAYFAKFYQYTGIDPYSENHNMNIIKVPIEEVELKEQYDVVLVLDVLEHLQDDNVIKKFIDNNLKDDGIAIITVPANPKLFNEHDIKCGHYRRYTKNDLIKLLSGYEYKIYYYNSILYPMEYIYRKITKGKDNLRQIPNLVNTMLYLIISIEYFLLPYLPKGLSMLAIVKKKGGVGVERGISSSSI